MAGQQSPESYWIIDILPRQVPAGRGGQYFAVERFLLSQPHAAETFQRFTRLLLKLNCYYDLRVSTPSLGTAILNPEPETLAHQVRSLPSARAGMCELTVEIPEAGGAIISHDAADLFLTLHHPTGELLETVRQLAQAEGLFVWEHREG